MLFDTDPADLDPETFGYAHPDEAEHRADRARGYASRAVVIAAAFLALTNAASLISWASTLEPNWAGRTARALSQAWAAQMSELGLDRFRNGVEALWADAADLPRRREPRPSASPPAATETGPG